MDLVKLFCVLIVEQLVRSATPFNPLLTYTMRYHKITATPNVTFNYTIDQFREKQLVNGYVTFITEKLADKVICTFYRCNQGGINCEYFQTWTITDICTKLKDKNQLWYRWYSSFVPPVECPIDKVNYQVRNATIEAGIAITWYPQCTDYYWKLTQNLYAGDICLGSYTLHFSFFGYRKRIKFLSRN